MCVRCECVWCVFSSDLFWTSSSLDIPAGVTQEKGDTGFLIYLLSAVRAFIFLARRIHPYSFPSSTVQPNFVYQRFRAFYFYFFGEEKSHQEFSFFVQNIPRNNEKGTSACYRQNKILKKITFSAQGPPARHGEQQ